MNFEFFFTCLFGIYCIFPEDVKGQQNCNNNEWKCRNNECISSQRVCNGVKDCTDGSDEVAESCLYIHCPRTSFRCSYGACVDEKSECDGKQDCADNSDELSISCQIQNISLTVCPEENFKCTSGQCIPNEYICDGQAECEDESDETLQLCKSFKCPPLSFKCDYGGCINAALKCDDYPDCFDESDESRRNCKPHTTTRYPVAHTFPPTRPSTHRTTTSSGEVNMPSSDLPPIPDIPKPCYLDPSHTLGLTVLTMIGNYPISPYENVPDQTEIRYKCHPKHVLDGPTINICIEGNWITDHPKCLKICPNRIFNGISFQATCENDGNDVSCTNDINRPGTRAFLSCQVGYRKPKKIASNILSCDENGKWDGRPYGCEPICGTEPVDAIPFISGGEVTPNSLAPWHVGIYSRISGQYEQICGGTIINPELIISAAHCFWNVVDGKLYNTSLFTVAAGKFYRDYYAAESLPIQFFNITEIHVAEGYNDIHLSYFNDIAVLVLDNFIIFNAFIKPICMDFLHSRERAIKPNVRGKIVGWGKIKQNESNIEVLQTVRLSTVTYEDCISQIDSQYHNLITGDKFCISDSKAVCGGDSGGGFVAVRIINGIRTYFLAGVISNSLINENECFGNIFTTVTNIQYHQRMIYELQLKYRLK